MAVSGISLLPDEGLLKALNSKFPCREVQIRQLAHLLWPSLPSPSTMVIHGLEATGKSAIVSQLLSSFQCHHAIVRSAECITVRHLLERTVSACEAALDVFSLKLDAGKCENLSALMVHLQRMLVDDVQGRPEKFTLVFDGVDRQRDAAATLLPALARLGEIVSPPYSPEPCQEMSEKDLQLIAFVNAQIPNLTVVLILTCPRPRFLHGAGIPHVHFAPYSRPQAISILSATPRKIFEQDDVPQFQSSSGEAGEETQDEDDDEDSAWVWTRFCGAVWDSLAKGAARDIVSFRSACHRLWRPFVAPIEDGTYGTRDFSKLMVARRAVFQGEDALVERVVGPAKPRSAGKAGAAVTKAAPQTPSHELPYYSKYLLCAAYLASYNPARQDPMFFMKSTAANKKKRKGRVAKPSIGANINKRRKINRTLLGAQPFVLERLLAIFHAIVPHAVISDADLLTQITTLSSLRLLTRTSKSTTGSAAAGGGAALSGKGGGADLLEPQSKYRVNVSWEYIRHLAASGPKDAGENGGGEGLGLEIEVYMAGE
ncbi:MAG: hypothetical protein M4579_002389 [Chaenotheca gracillima]|nr:MAG: hypothetical protein M4579_002389 [Chaenotheca gracillima]